MNRDRRIYFYRKLADSQCHIATSLTRRIHTLGTLRLLVFIVGVYFIYLFLRNWLCFAVALLSTLTVFIWLLRRYNTLVQKRERAVITEKLCRDELKAFAHDFSAFDGAAEHIDPQHDFSFDLDVFGEKSLFRQLNRTALYVGKLHLANCLKCPLTDEATIRKRQNAIKELSQNDAFCMDFRVDGTIAYDVEEVHPEFFFSSQTKKLHLLWKIGIIAAPILFFGSLVLSWLNLVSGGMVLGIYLMLLLISSIPMKHIKGVWYAVGKKARVLKNYAKLFQHIEQTNFESLLLIDLKNQLQQDEKASQAIKKLARHTGNLDLAFAFPVMLLINPLCFWNVIYATKIEKWLTRYSSQTTKWFDILAQMDALVSLGTFAANNPDYIYPEISKDFCFIAEAIGHPQIPRERCVKNTIHIERKPYFMIVTGANMAGKSTYLRTVGVNHLLTSIGAPVCAEKMMFSPGKLLTNLRTADSLVNNESYFFAELKRLKMIIERLQSADKNLFIILDEILKGTNSDDKQKGSFQLMKRLIKLNGNGIIATHDLALGRLEEEFPDAVRNYHFEADISEDTLSFDYTLRRGIAQNMNASFLMRKMGITE